MNLLSLVMISITTTTLAIYGTYLDSMNKFIYKSRKVESKSAKVLKEMNIYVTEFSKSKLFGKTVINMNKIKVCYFFLILSKSRFYLELSDSSCKYTELPHQFRKAMYFEFLKKRYPKIFGKLSTDKDKVLKSINNVAKRNIIIDAIKKDLCIMLEEMSVTDINKEEI